MQRLENVSAELELILTRGRDFPAIHSAADIRRETVWVPMRDGIKLATDLYLPPLVRAPAIAYRTPYDRTVPAEIFVSLAQKGYVVISQDCRGTGASEPNVWDTFVYEREDSFDFVEWAVQQDWFDGFLSALGGSYGAAVQWAMAMHPRMTAIAPEVGGLCIYRMTTRYYMFVNAFSRTVGKGADKAPISFSDMEREMLGETLAGGYFNEPMRTRIPDALLERFPNLCTADPQQGKSWLWEHLCSLAPGQRAELMRLILGKGNVDYDGVWGITSFFDYRPLPGWVVFPSATTTGLAESIRAPALLLTGWYDWGIADTLATWEALMQSASPYVKNRSRLVITANAHNVPGYHEGTEGHPELVENYRRCITDLRLQWYEAVRNETVDSWPTVIYYLMGANRWYTASAWPPPEARSRVLYLGPDRTLTSVVPKPGIPPDTYKYEPQNATPTVGGNIVSSVYPPGSVDVSEVQSRPDVLTYTTDRFDQDVDVVGPLRLILYVSSSAVDTDFSARLSDVFPDGRAIQLQSGMLRTRYRDPVKGPEPLESGRIYRLEIDMWATANRFARGHRLRLDISSADFPRFERNTNRGGESGSPVEALQSVYHDAEHPSQLLFSIMNAEAG